MIAETSAKVQLAAGGALMSTPFWVSAVQTVSMVAGMIAAVCGAIIGINAVWKIFRKKREA